MSRQNKVITEETIEPAGAPDRCGEAWATVLTTEVTYNKNRGGYVLRLDVAEKCDCGDHALVRYGIFTAPHASEIVQPAKRFHAGTLDKLTRDPVVLAKAAALRTQVLAQHEERKARDAEKRAHA